MSLAQVNLQHVFLIGPLLFYIGTKRDMAPQWSYVALATITAMIPFIVTYNYTTLSYRSITNAFHYLVWLPLFFYIAWKGYNNKLASWSYPMLQLLGLSAITIHLFLWAQKMNLIQ
jgi:hypothetical protein